MDGEAGWWTTSGNIGLPPLARVMGVGRQQHFITDNNVRLLNDGSYTYLHPATGTFTAIDLSLCSPHILMEIDFEYGSDHFPIVLKISISLPDSLTRWNFSRADWVKFDHLCKVNL